MENEEGSQAEETTVETTVETQHDDSAQEGQTFEDLDGENHFEDPVDGVYEDEEGELLPSGANADQHAAKVDIKEINYKYGEEEKGVPADAIFQAKIDGKEQDVTVQELLNDYSGKTNWNEKYQTLAEEKKGFQQEVQTIEGYVNKFRELCQKTDTNGKADVVGGMAYLAEMAGMNPLDFKEGVRQQMLPQVEQWNNMSEEERKSVTLKEENQYYEHKRDEQQTLIQTEQANLASEKELRSLMSENQVDDATLGKAWELLDKEVPQDQEISNQMLVQRAGLILKTREAEQFIAEINPSVISNHPNAADTVAGIMERNPDFTREDVASIIEQLYGKSKDKVVSEKAREAQPKMMERDANLPVQEGDEYEYATFDDLDY